MNKMLPPIVPYLVAFAAFGSTPGAGTVAMQLEKKLLPDPVFEVAELKPIPGELPEGLHAFAAMLPLRKGEQVRAVVIERDGAKPVWMLDRNLDGELSPDEQIEVGGTPTLIEFPLKGEPFELYPMHVKAVDLPPGWQADMRQRDIRLLYYSHAVDVTGHLQLDGLSYQFFYRLNSDDFSVSLKDTWVAVDSDRDGKIDLARWSEEMMYALGKPAVFKIGKRYVRTDAVDLKAMTAQVKEVDASEYRLISMRVGQVLQNFSFADLEGKPRSLKTEGGSNYTMLYFWSTWCAICKSEIGEMDEADRRFRDRGFRVIGLNGDKDPAIARKFLKERGVNFSQARWDSVADLVEHRFRIDEWPTAILLDAEFRVVSTNSQGEPHIRKDGLMNTLERLTTRHETH